MKFGYFKFEIMRWKLWLFLCVMSCSFILFYVKMSQILCCPPGNWIVVWLNLVFFLYNCLPFIIVRLIQWLFLLQVIVIPYLFIFNQEVTIFRCLELLILSGTMLQIYPNFYNTGRNIEGIVYSTFDCKSKNKVWNSDIEKMRKIGGKMWCCLVQCGLIIIFF